MYPDYTHYETPYSTVGMNRNYSHEKKLVELNYDLKMTFVQKYINEEKLLGGVLSTIVEEFLSDKVDIQRLTFSSFTQSLIDSGKIIDNRELYTALQEFTEYAHKNNEMHKDKVAYYKKLMSQELFKNNANAKAKQKPSYEQIDYSKYEYSNFRKTDSNLIVNLIYLTGGTIYLNSSAEICFRQKANAKIKSHTKKSLEVLLGTILGHKIKITEESTQDFTYEEEQEYNKQNEDIKIAINNKLLEGGV